MIKYILTVASFEDDYGFCKKVVEYNENELNTVLNLICGLTNECLLKKECQIDYIELDKKIGNELVPLLNFQFENFTYRYCLRKNKEEK